jgi:hypothetical protein
MAEAAGGAVKDGVAGGVATVGDEVAGGIAEAAGGVVEDRVAGGVATVGDEVAGGVATTGAVREGGCSCIGGGCPCPM